MGLYQPESILLATRHSRVLEMATLSPRLSHLFSVVCEVFSAHRDLCAGNPLQTMLSAHAPLMGELAASC